MEITYMRADWFTRPARKIVRMIGVLVVGVVALSACTSSSTNEDLGDYSSYLGDYSYNSSISAMVYEDMEGEGPGIQYREVTDLPKLISKSPLSVCIYFYAGLRTDTSGVTASVEELAEEYHDTILFVSIDGLQEKDWTSAYAIGAFPDFVMIKNGIWTSSFGSIDRDSWTTEDLIQWVTANNQ
jgi:hypothetical protein